MSEISFKGNLSEMWSQIYFGLHVKYPLFLCHVFMKLEFSRQILEKKYYDVKFDENSSSGSRVVPCGQTDRRS
jgi:hypothetical protein